MGQKGGYKIKVLTIDPHADIVHVLSSDTNNPHRVRSWHIKPNFQRNLDNKIRGIIREEHPDQICIDVIGITGKLLFHKFVVKEVKE